MEDRILNELEIAESMLIAVSNEVARKKVLERFTQRKVIQGEKNSMVYLARLQGEIKYNEEEYIPFIQETIQTLRGKE